MERARGDSTLNGFTVRKGKDARRRPGAICDTSLHVD